MKKIIGLVLVCLVLSVGTFLFLAINRGNNSPEHSRPLLTADRKLEARRKIVELSRSALQKGESDAKISGANNDVLLLESKRLSDFEILSIIGKDLDGWREVGFSQIVITDKDGKRREVDLTALDNK